MAHLREGGFEVLLRNKDLDLGRRGEFGEVVLRSEKRSSASRVRRFRVEFGCDRMEGQSNAWAVLDVET
jgi:hypothetical protein